MPRDIEVGRKPYFGPAIPMPKVQPKQKPSEADWRSFYTGKVKEGFTPYGWKREKSGEIRKKMFYMPNPKKQKTERKQLQQEYMKYLAGKYGTEEV